MIQQTTITIIELQKFCDISELATCVLKINDNFDLIYKNKACIDDYFNNEECLSLIKKACEDGDACIKDITVYPNNVSKDEQKWINVSISYVGIDSESFALVSFIDVTEYKNREFEISDAVTEAKMLNEIKSDFLATMSHEIRTPMQSIYGFLELISEEEKLSEDVSTMVGKAKRAASGLLEILDDILDLAKVNAGKMELDMFEVPVRTLAYGVLECMEIKLQGKDIKLVPQVAEDVPFVVTGDPTRLRQILLNLIGNAMKFTESGQITLNITNITNATDKDDIVLKFEIIDTGIGMSQDVADKLFQPFMQADSSTSRQFGGTGLGLSICHKLIELMGGKIGITSAVGEGSNFWFEIPTKALGTDTNVELPSLEGLAVISIEDHPAAAREIQSSLQSMGAKVESCSTFEDGMNLIKQRPFDVAIIDQGLPDGLGIDIAKEAIKMRPFMGLIIYTVRDDIGLQHSAKSLGATYLSKPASRLGLGEAVKAAARKKMPNISHRPKRLLIAEDTASVRDVIQRQLEKLKVEADFVENGVQAMQMLAKNEHGILFTDLHMPDMDGYELTKRLRGQEEAKNTDSQDRFPIIALTADVQLAQRQAYLSHGFDECLLKPISLGQLRQLLVRWGLLLEEQTDDVKENNIEVNNLETVTDGKQDQKPPIDKNDLIAQMGAFDTEVVDMLKIFVDMTEPYIGRMKDAFDNQDIGKLVEEAHSMKGAARSACCNHLGDIAHGIQEVSEQGRLISEQSIQDMVEEFERIKVYIEVLYKELYNNSD